MNNSAMNSNVEITANEEMLSNIQHKGGEEVTEENKRTTRSSVRGA